MEDSEVNKPKHFVPHCIMQLNEFITEDPVLVMAMKHLFRWANDMGLQGKTVSHLILVPPDTKNPMYCSYKLLCQIQCTEEERKVWEEVREMNISKAVNDMLTD